MADKKVRRTAEERKAALEAEIAELEAKEIERAKKALVAKTERLVKVTALRDKYNEEVVSVENDIFDLKAIIEGTEDEDEDDEQAEEVSQPTLSAAG